MNWINTNTFSHQNYFPARLYAAAFLSPTDGDKAINILPTWSFFQADQHQNSDQINSDSSVHSIAGYAVKITIEAYLAINRVWRTGGLYPAALVPTRQRIRKTATHNGLQKYFTKTTTSKRRNNV